MVFLFYTIIEVYTIFGIVSLSAMDAGLPESAATKNFESDSPSAASKVQ